MRYVKSFVGCFLVLLMLVIPASAAVPDRASIESASLTEYGLLMSSFEQQKKDGKFSGEYPDWYAGAYIDDSGELVVLVTDLTASREKEIISTTNNSSIDICEADISMNELWELQKHIESCITELLNEYVDSSKLVSADKANLVNSFVSVGIDEINNRVCVELSDISSFTVGSFKHYVSKSENIVFSLSGAGNSIGYSPAIEEENSARVTYYPGGYFSFNGFNSRIGFRCNLNGVNGFMSAGHNVVLTGAEVGDNLGNGTLISYRYQAGTVDAAFVATNSGYSVGTISANGDVISNYYLTSIPTGTTVYACGGSSGSRLTGSVTGASASRIAENGYFLITDQVKISYNYAPVSGDSGGIVYTYLDGRYSVVGIHCAGSSTTGYATKASNIVSVMGCIPY